MKRFLKWLNAKSELGGLRCRDFIGFFLAIGLLWFGAAVAIGMTYLPKGDRLISWFMIIAISLVVLGIIAGSLLLSSLGRPK